MDVFKDAKQLEKSEVAAKLARYRETPRWMAPLEAPRRTASTKNAKPN